MVRPQMLLMQFYRQEPSDLGIQGIPAPDDGRLEETLSAGLIGHYNDAHRPSHHRAHHARALTPDGSEIRLKLRALPGDKTEKVLDPTTV
jgi:hypothetical protein